MTIKLKPLKRRNPNNPQIKEYVKAIEDGKNALHILPSGHGWKIKKIGGPDLETLESKQEAISRARSLLGTSRSEIIIHDASGLISAARTYPHTIHKV